MYPDWPRSLCLLPLLPACWGFQALWTLCICCAVPYTGQSPKVRDRGFRTLFWPSGTFLKAQCSHFLSYINEVSPDTKHMHVLGILINHKILGPCPQLRGDNHERLEPGVRCAELV